MGSSLISQAIASELMMDIPKAKAMRKDELRGKRDLVMEILEAQRVPCEYDKPNGGMSLWIKLHGIDTRQLAQSLLRQQLAIAPGNLFSTGESHAEFLRLPFLLDTKSLTTGVDRLAVACRKFSGLPSLPVEDAFIV